MDFQYRQAVRELQELKFIGDNRRCNLIFALLCVMLASCWNGNVKPVTIEEYNPFIMSLSDSITTDSEKALRKALNDVIKKLKESGDSIYSGIDFEKVWNHWREEYEK